MSSGKHLSKSSPKPILPDDGVLRLYSMRFCPYAHRVHLVLDAKKIPYHPIYINLSEKPEWFLKLSETTKVPALEVVKEAGTPILVESLIICDYLDEKYPERPLLPKDPLKKAQDKILIERFADFINKFYKLILNKDTKDLDLENAGIFQGLDIYEVELRKRDTPFFGGVQPGMLDYMIWPWCERFAALKYQYGDKIDLDASRFEKLIKWRDLMTNDDAVKCFYIDGETHAKYMSSRRAGKTNYDLLA